MRRLALVLLLSALLSACGGDSLDFFFETEQGLIAVSTTTLGTSLDQDGYIVILNLIRPRSIGVNDSITLSNVHIGNSSLELTGVASNCTVQGSNPLTVTVTDGRTASAQFIVSCFTPLQDQIVFESHRDGLAAIYVMGVDGSNPVRLSGVSDGDIEPDVSPDGTKIVFARLPVGGQSFDIYVMNADGSNPVQLTSGARRPIWSPDGSKIAYNAASGINVMNADGSDRVTLGPGFGATWSPDGSRIAFVSNDGFLGIMNADGSNSVVVADGFQFQDLDWSPLGNQIALSTSVPGGGLDIHVVNVDGSNLVRITTDPLDDADPAWSPDGSRIAFRANRDDPSNSISEVYVMNANGTNQVNLTNNPAQDVRPSWSP